MTNVAPHLKRLRETPILETSESGRKVVVLVGNGAGPKVAIRAKKVIVRICGLAEGGYLELELGDEFYSFRSDGEFSILGGEFAKATSYSDSSVICEILT